MLEPPAEGVELLAWQSRLEAELNEALEAEFTEGLLAIRALALSHSLTQASARDEWVRAVDRALAKVGLASSDQLRDELLELGLGDEAYRAVETVDALFRQQLSRPDPEEYLAALEDVLGLESATAALVAAGTPDSRITRRLKRWVLDWMRPAKSNGHTWRSQIRRGVRTGFTGLTGSLVMARLAVTGARTKKWVTKHDDKVRATHAAADGQTVPLNAPFTVGGQLLQFPGDPRASIGETVNCRCVCVSGDDQ